jgi:carbonic anhydrase/acetyltransferase-like protein (isoleucine patch superfamily)
MQHNRISISGKSPSVDGTAFIAESAVLVGDVSVGAEASVWYGAVVRGDCGRIIIGKMANVQDNVVVHSDTGGNVEICEGATIGHGAVVHCSRVGKYALIGMNAVLLNGAEIGDGSIVGAGAVVKENEKVPPGSLVVGVPAKVVKQLSQEQMDGSRKNAEEYVRLSRMYLPGRE